jgi:hypothetical protein
MVNLSAGVCPDIQTMVKKINKINHNTKTKRNIMGTHFIVKRDNNFMDKLNSGLRLEKSLRVLGISSAEVS